MTAEIVKIVSFSFKGRSIHTLIFSVCIMHLDDDDDDKHKKKNDTKLKLIETIAMSSTLK